MYTVSHFKIQNRTGYLKMDTVKLFICNFRGRVHPSMTRAMRRARIDVCWSTLNTRLLHRLVEVAGAASLSRKFGMRGWVAIPCVLACIPVVRAQEGNLLLTDTANFLDAGLTALGLLTALVTTVLRRRMDAELNTRDLLTLMRGESQGNVKKLTIYDSHSLSQMLVLVEENSMIWAQQMFSYYSATTGKKAELLPAAWLSAPTSSTKCSCNQVCKCLKFERVEGVCKHLTTVAPKTIFRVDDTYDAIICSPCYAFNCHESHNKFYQDAGGAFQGPLGSKTVDGRLLSHRALVVSAARIFASEGHTGLMLLEPAIEESVTWNDTISEASTIKDSEERGNENPFSVVYRKALVGESSSNLRETDYDPSLWWLSRMCAFLLACVLVILFRTDPFSSALLSRRALRGYIVDSTQTKLPLSSFCSSAKCELSLEDRFIVVILEPLRGAFSLPKSRLLVACVLEVVLVLFWIAILAIVPWFHLVGSSYQGGVPIWASAVACSVAIVASIVNIRYWWIGGSMDTRLKWGVLTAACCCIDGCVIALFALSWAKVMAGHWLATSVRALIIVAAILQWALGVYHLPTMTNSTFNEKGWSVIVPYALTFLRLLALVAGGGKWA